MTMTTKITMALIAAFIMLAPPVLAAGHATGENAYTKKLAQYCNPQDELPGTEGVLYC
jgi:hypothetical protein